MSAKILVAQLGARRHYAIPRMLHESGQLERFFTDICATDGWPALLRYFPKSLLPLAMRRLAGRIPVGVPTSKLTTFPMFGLKNVTKLWQCRTYDEQIAHFLQSGEDFCQLVLQHGFGNAEAVYTFDRGGLELLTAANKRGLKTVMEQTVAPLAVDRHWAQEEMERYPEWATPPVYGESYSRFAAREQAEWEQADLILCGSDFVLQGIKECGGPTERCVIVPYGVDSRFEVPQKEPHSGLLRVLTVGEVGLRKGSPYILEAAKQMEGRAEFRMAGKINVLPPEAQRLGSKVQLLGTVPRAEIQCHYAWADVFLLPSLCEGSATVTYEALASGLPVICTPNTGSVVRDGIDGFIVPPRDVAMIIKHLEFFNVNRSALVNFSAQARTRAKDFSLVQYRERLLNALNGLMK